MDQEQYSSWLAYVKEVPDPGCIQRL
jgi:hypothetical protein